MPPALSLKSTKTGTQFPCQRIHVTGSYPLGGWVECPDMVQLPPSNDRAFLVLPLGFEIQIIDAQFESKKPSFLVRA